MIELYDLAGLFPGVTAEGFSAYKSSLSVSANAQITTWSVTSPNFSSTNFNSTTGNYTAPVSGLYVMQANVNYSTNAAITTTLDADITPSFDIRRTSVPTGNLTTSLLPIVNLNLDLTLVTLTIRAVLGSAAVTVSGLFNLTAGDVVGLFYNADGMTIGLTLSDIEWFIFRIS